MTALLVVIIIAVIGLIVFGAIRSTPEHKSKEGELHVHNILAQLPEDYTILDDVMLKTGNGTTQIDHVVVSRYGVFAIGPKTTVATSTVMTTVSNGRRSSSPMSLT